MKKEIIKKAIKNVFSLTDFTKGRVKRLTLHIQDVPSYDNVKGEKIDLGQCAIISGTLQIYKYYDETKVDNINFTLPLQSNVDFKKHILSIIKSALEADAKRKLNG